MIKLTTLSIFILITNLACGQNSIFNNYDFNTGDYHVQGIYLNEHNFPNIADTISDFFIDDIKTLNMMKSSWQFADLSDRYIESYTYRITIFKDKQALESIWINLIKGVIRTSKGTFVFDYNLFLELRNNLNPITFHEYKFSSVKVGKDSLNNIINNDSILSYFCYWDKFDGTFSAKIPITEEQLSTEDVKLKLEKELSNQFPNETFQLTYTTTLDFAEGAVRFFEVKCSETMYINFRWDKSEWKGYEPVLYLRIKN